MNHAKTILFAVITALPLSLAYGSESDVSLIPDTDTWTMTLTPQLTYGAYNNSPTRDTVASAGILAAAQYLERGGIAVSLSRTELKMLQNAPTLNQNSGGLSGYWNLTPDLLPGHLTLRAEVLRAENNDTTNETDEVNVISPQVSFLNYSKTCYFDLGYAHSRYGDSAIGNGSLAVVQWTPTVGFGFNDGYDWLQLRTFNILVSNAARAQNNSGTNATEVKWTHYFSPEEWLPEQVQLGALFGKRIYAVDSGNIYNSSDIQQGGASLAVQWLLTSDVRLMMQSGQDRYLTGGGITYSGTYIYIGISNQW